MTTLLHATRKLDIADLEVRTLVSKNKANETFSKNSGK